MTTDTMTFEQAVENANSFAELIELPYSTGPASPEEATRLFEKTWSFADNVENYQALIFAGYALDVGSEPIMSAFEAALKRAANLDEIFDKLLYPFIEESERDYDQALPKAVARGLELATTAQVAMGAWMKTPFDSEIERTTFTRVLDFVKTEDDCQHVAHELMETRDSVWSARLYLQHLFVKADSLGFMKPKE